MKRHFLLLICIIFCFMPFLNARPMHKHHHRPVHRHIPPRHHHHHYRHCAWPYVVGAIGSYALINSIARPTPVVVQQPVVVRPTSTTVTVWEDGHFEDQVQSNGTVIRVWVPGRYVTRVIAQ